jgi:hypothetical protein
LKIYHPYKKYSVYLIKCLCFALDSLRKTAKISIDYKKY